MRDLLLWSQAHRRESREQWRQALLIVNTVSGIMGGDTMTLADLQGTDSTPAPDRQEYEAFKGRTAEWAAEHVTDHAPPEM